MRLVALGTMHVLSATQGFIFDFEEASRRLFTFLKEMLGGAMPSVDEATSCAVAGRAREAQMRRHDEPRVAPYNPFLDPANGTSKASIERCVLARRCVT
jgi:hypothetical protein